MPTRWEADPGIRAAALPYPGPVPRPLPRRRPADGARVRRRTAVLGRAAHAPARAVALACAGLLAATAGGCLADDPALRSPFTEVPGQAQQQPVPMPSAEVPGDPGSRGAAPEPDRDRAPCDVDPVTLAACLPEVTALAGAGPGEGVAATADGGLWRIRPGLAPERVADAGGRVIQLMAMPDSPETGQILVLRADGTVSRLTLLPGGADYADREARPGAVAMYIDRGGRPDFLMAGDPGIEILGVCAVPPGAPPMMTARLDGHPTLIQWNGEIVEALTGVDVDDSLGGCAYDGANVVVAVPGAGRVVAVPMTLEPLDPVPGIPGDPGGPRTWVVGGGPDILVEGAFGHIGTVAVVPGDSGPEIWGGTVNRALAEGGPGSSDDRVVRFPAGGAGGSPD